ncbi:hypothetical protein HPP92_026022 [Vanilla planifolia]|uniref:Uncharacterized protein n=1 Tax=Vanilla planifolia TaxID=51239 RepID=A0A835U6T7_VANPL|nr:hypothetical protein HPP92_026299 [Vanilla planifolia]KAG0451764.1 hypothetical protein HPP92_026022 [Vanilla planifolia]
MVGMKVAEILKDRLSWYRDCRCLNMATVCERSLTPATGGPPGPQLRTLSGLRCFLVVYLIRPCEEVAQ